MNFTVKARFGTQSLPVPVSGGVGMTLLVRDEPWMHPLLNGLLKLFPGCFVDVGVNVGQTLCKVKAIEPGRSYFGFEPNPVCVNYTQGLSQLHGYDKVTLIPTGLSDRDGLLQLEFHFEAQDDAAATVVSDFRPGMQVRRRLTVPVLSLGSAARTLAMGAMGIVKIDVEGGECEVLLGMEDQLKQHRPAVVLEILPAGTHAMRLARQQDVEALFQRNDYVLYRVSWQKNALYLQRITGPLGVYSDQALSNYLALPVERIDSVIPELAQQ